MKPISSFLRDYKSNSRFILSLLNNPLKKPENLAEKDALEKDFYDGLAQKYIDGFDEEYFRYDEEEDFPLRHQYFYKLIEDVSGKKILDCCCGYGFTSVKCAKRGANIWGIDISPKMIQVAKKNANFNQVSDKIDFYVMSAQKLDFDDNYFDFVVGLGALHHLNLDLAGQEISRVLKPGGKAIFLEPRLSHTWLVRLRSLFPNKCYESPGGGLLGDKDIEQVGKNFASAKIQYFMFLSKLGRFPLMKTISRQLEYLDFWLVRKCPYVKYLCFAFVLEFEK